MTTSKPQVLSFQGADPRKVPFKVRFWCALLGHSWQGYMGPTESGKWGRVDQYCSDCGAKRSIVGTYHDWY